MDEGEGRVVRPDGFDVRSQLMLLRQEHRDLDASIVALQVQASPDLLLAVA